MSEQWRIRLLNGVLQGREVRLYQGRLLIGEQGCDLCVPVRQNARILFEDRQNQLFVSAGDIPVRVNGKRHKSDRPLPDSGILRVAGLRLAFGKAGLTLNTEADLSRLHRCCLWGIAGALVLGVLMVVLGKDAFREKESSAVAAGMPARLLDLKAARENGIDVHRDTDGAFVLSGECKHSEGLQQLRRQLESINVNFRDRVICDDALVHSVEDVLMQAGYSNVSVVSRGGGQVLIQGDISMGPVWIAVQKTLHDIPGLRGWTVSGHPSGAIDDIIRQIVSAGLSERVSVAPVGEGYVISGIISDEERRVLEKLLSGLRKTYPSLELSYQPVAASSAIYDAALQQVVAVIHNRNGGYLLLDNGERLYAGSVLAGGWRLLTLHGNTVVLRGKNTLGHYTFSF